MQRFFARAHLSVWNETMDMEVTMLLARVDTGEKLELFDERGRPVGSVILPIELRPFGPDHGTVFLSRPLPALPGPTRTSSQAA